MNIKKTVSIIICLAIGVSVSIGLSYVYAQWSGPSTNPPVSGDAPVITSVLQQVKPSGLSVNVFSAVTNSVFDQQTQIRGNILRNKAYGTFPEKVTVQVGGPKGSDTYYVDTEIEGRLEVGSTLGSSELVSTTKPRLCSDSEGHVVICPQYLSHYTPVYSATSGAITGPCEVTWTATRNQDGVNYSNLINKTIRVTYDIFMDNDVHRTGVADFAVGSSTATISYSDGRPDTDFSGQGGNAACSAAAPDSPQVLNVQEL